MAFRISLNHLPATFTRDYLLNNFHSMSEVDRDHTYFNPSSKVPTLPLPCIRECNCSNMSRSSRIDNVEGPLIDKVKQIYEKSKPLIVYSKGSGECYQELAFCVGLAEEGYEVKQIVLADTKYTTNQPDNILLTFSTFVKLLFPNVQISVFKFEKEYFEEIKDSKQPKPDIVLCVDLPFMELQRSKDEYSAMLGSPSNECILAYHNNVEPTYNAETFVDKIHG